MPVLCVCVSVDWKTTLEVIHEILSISVLDRGSLTGWEFTRYRAPGPHCSVPSSGITSGHCHNQLLFPPKDPSMEWQFSHMLHYLTDGRGSGHTGPVIFPHMLLTELPARWGSPFGTWAQFAGTDRATFVDTKNSHCLDWHRIQATPGHSLLESQA